MTGAEAAPAAHPADHAPTHTDNPSHTGHHHQHGHDITQDDTAIQDAEASENTPLLPASESRDNSPRRSRSLFKSFGTARRWPSLLALFLLCVVVVLIMVFAFAAPNVMEQYAAQALVFEPSSLSIDSLTKDGVRARIQGEFYLDAHRVQNKAVRDLGSFGTWIAHEIESGKSEVEISLPEYGNVVLGRAHVPGVKVNVRSGRRNQIDILTDLEPGEKDGIRRIANDWIAGRIGDLRVVGAANVPLKSGLFSLGSQQFKHEIILSGDDVPSIPAYDIQRLIINDSGDKGVEADVSLLISNEYPLDFVVPSLGFNILVDNCQKSDPFIQVAHAVTSEIHVLPKEQFQANVTGLARELPESLVQFCPGTKESPLDLLVASYMQGNNTKIYVRGSKEQKADTPDWIGNLMSEVTVPVPLPGRTFGHLIKSFSLEDTQFSLPDPFAEPDSPEANPQISAIVKAVVALPREMNFNVEAQRVRAKADVFYKGEKLGNLDLHKWQEASSTRIEGDEDEGPELLVASRVEHAPLRITNEDLFADVIQDLLFSNKSVLMHIKATVDVAVKTALGELTVRQIPAEGEVPVQPISSHLPGAGFGALHPAVGDLRILDTTSSSLTLSAMINLTNPTPYSANVPYVDIQILKNGSLLGHATARQLSVHPGNNTNLLVQAVYNPLGLDGKKARLTGRELLSQYLSGQNATLTVRTHAGTFPSQPRLGTALSRFEVEIPIPHTKQSSPPTPEDPDDPDNPDGNEDDKPHFIRDATFHLIGSSATFNLFSPLKHTTLVIERINATAYYPHVVDDKSTPSTQSSAPSHPLEISNMEEIQEDPVGDIFYDSPFAVPPVDEEGNGVPTPRLPVSWHAGGLGFDAVRRALGGRLKLSAFAHVDVRLGRWRERIWFKGRGIGTSVRLA